ncbi:protein CrdC [Corallococcus sp. H22C18031201]|nr:protein CrdC [Corallococcus sp. H22C18031201]
MGPASRVEGTLLCRAGAHRIAFAAHEVAFIASAVRESTARTWSARRAFREAASESRGRVLVAPSGESVGVDALELDADTHSVLPPPHVTATLSGGSLRGFILVRGALWPLLGLADFEHYLRGLDAEAT